MTVVFVCSLIRGSIAYALDLPHPSQWYDWSRGWQMGVFIALGLVMQLRILPVTRQVQRCRCQCCTRCLYDLRATPGDRCPECGQPFDRNDWRTPWGWWGWWA